MRRIVFEGFMPSRVCLALPFAVIVGHSGDRLEWFAIQFLAWGVVFGVEE